MISVRFWAGLLKIPYFDQVNESELKSSSIVLVLFLIIPIISILACFIGDPNHRMDGNQCNPAHQSHLVFISNPICLYGEPGQMEIYGMKIQEPS